MKIRTITTISKGVLIAAIGLATPLCAQTALPEGFAMGPVFSDYGPVTPIADADMQIPTNMKFQVAFDLAEGAKAGTLNRNLASAARFINMHVAAGVAREDIKLALVVHGSAVFDMANDKSYIAKHSKLVAPAVTSDKRVTDNPNAELIKQLLDNNVRIIICGQSASAQGLKKADFLPGIELALSAMTAHALLQQDGYTLNPF